MASPRNVDRALLGSRALILLTVGTQMHSIVWFALQTAGLKSIPKLKYLRRSVTAHIRRRT